MCIIPVSSSLNSVSPVLENLERKPMGLDATDTRIQQIGYLLTCIENLPRLTGYSGGNAEIPEI